MPPRSRRFVLGLRGRIVGALLVTTVATLGIAAVALLGPLEQQLRNSALATLQREVSQATAGFQKLNLGASQTSPVAQRRLQSQANALAVRIGAPNVSVFAYPLVQLTFYDAESERGDTFDDVNSAFRNLAEGKKGKAAAVPSFGTLEGTDVARVAMPITLPTGRGGQTYVLAVRKTIEEIPGAVKVVRTAFITAALAGVALTLILGIPLAATLVRRLRRLRDAALGLARGGRSVEVPVDRARDEVGDLTRTFATMQRRLQHQEDARRAFVATASHELRTPLTSLDGMLELLDDDLRSGSPDIEDAIGLLERARAQSRRLGRLAAEVSTPGSAAFRHFLRPRRIQARFGPAPRAAAAVAAWLRRHGLATGAALGDGLLLPASGPVARIEADRFAVLVTAMQEAELTVLGAEILATVGRAYSLDGIEVDPQACVGIAFVPGGTAEVGGDTSLDPSTLLQRAEMAMLAARAKQEQLQIYRPSMGEVYRRRFQLVTQFRQAVEQGRIIVHYQPKVDLAERELVGVEALVRWMHPEFGLVSPAEFVEAIEATGSIDILLGHVLDIVLQQLRDWTAQGIRIGAAVNLSVRNLLAENFSSTVAGALRRHQVPAL